MIRNITIEDALNTENISLLKEILDDNFSDPCMELEYCYEQANDLFEQAVYAKTHDEELWCKRSARCFRTVANELYEEIRETSCVYQFLQFVKTAIERVF